MACRLACQRGHAARALLRPGGCYTAAMPPYDSNVTNSLIHLYRGEMGRMTMYRVRLDTTTNWAIVTIAAISTFGLGNPEVPHVIFLLLLALILFF